MNEKYCGAMTQVIWDRLRHSDNTIEEIMEKLRTQQKINRRMSVFVWICVLYALSVSVEFRRQNEQLVNFSNNASDKLVEVADMVRKLGETNKEGE